MAREKFIISTLQIICTEDSISIESAEYTGVNKSRNKAEMKDVFQSLRKVWYLVRKNNYISKPSHL